MDFYEVLVKVIDILQREGRTSYRALKRQLNLDDEYLEDLKVELIEVKQCAVDQDGKMLVWTGDATSVEVVSTQPTQAESPPPEPSPPDAERRQLTVMFCDLVGSTPLSEQLDPEDLREVVRAYQQACAEVVQRFDGHIAQLLGDALLVYFGWPQAHEDDAQRAVRTGLGMVEAMGTLNTRLEQEKGVRLAIRVGIHTGLVVIGEMGGGGHQEQLALGETPNIASRIQGLAEPDTIVISEATFRLIEGYFTCQALGEHTLKGVAEPMDVYRVLRESGAQSRLDIASTRGLTPLVGREQEVGLLLERWNQVKDGMGHVVLLSGEAGIGKSRLVQVVKDHVTGEAHTRLECRSSPYYQHTALYPVIDLFHRVLHWHQDASPEEKLTQLEHALSPYALALDETIPLVAGLLSLAVPADRYPPLTLSAPRQRQRTLETIVTILLEQAERQPVLFILEDLHWTDPSTLELLTLLLDQTPTASIFTVLTCRPTFQPPWSSRSYLTQVTLHRLTRQQVASMAEGVAGGKHLPPEVLHQIVAKTDGVPLFVEEMTKTLLESGHLQDTGGRYELAGAFPALAIPATLHDSLMARLDRLGSAKGIAQLGAVIGRQFPYAVLHAVSPLDEATLQRALRRLVEAELVYQHGLPPRATYLFKHALIRDVAYASLLKSTRQQVHQQIAQVLEARFAETAETQPELLGYHCTEAGRLEQAVGYWHQAGERAMARSAHVEAIAHLTKGLGVLHALPASPTRHEQELRLQAALGPALIAARGYAVPEVEQAYNRARELCGQVGETPIRFPVLWGLWQYYLGRGQYETAQHLGEQLLSLAQQQPDSGPLLAAHYALGVILVMRGACVPALERLEAGLMYYDPQRHRDLALQYGQDFGVGSRGYAACAQWLRGHPDRALAETQAMLVLAREGGHPYSLARALILAAIVHIYRREWQVARELTEETLVLVTEQGFPLWEGFGRVLQGSVQVVQGQTEEGLAQMRRGLAAWQATGAEFGRTLLLSLLAEACGHAGEIAEGLRLLVEALAQVDTTGERFYEACLYRLKGELLRMADGRLWNTDWTPEACFQQALDVARRQHAKSFELRAATSLARLWQYQDKRQDAYDLLAPVYGWFTEGFDTADLQDAKALLDELA